MYVTATNTIDHHANQDIYLGLLVLPIFTFSNSMMESLPCLVISLVSFLRSDQKTNEDHSIHRRTLPKNRLACIKGANQGQWFPQCQSSLPANEPTYHIDSEIVKSCQKMSKTAAALYQSVTWLLRQYNSIWLWAECIEGLKLTWSTEKVRQPGTSSSRRKAGTYIIFDVCASRETRFSRISFTKGDRNCGLKRSVSSLYHSKEKVPLESCSFRREKLSDFLPRDPTETLFKAGFPE